MDNTATGINTDEIHTTKISLLNQLELINEITVNLDQIKENIKVSLQGSGQNDILNVFTNIEDQFPVVKSNVESISTNLTEVINSYEEFVGELASQIIANSRKIEEGGIE